MKIDKDSDLMKFRKEDLAKALIDEIRQTEELDELCLEKDSLKESVQRNLRDSKNEVVHLQRKLSRMQDAMKTITSVKYHFPYRDISGELAFGASYGEQEDVIEHEPEELLFIRHLYELSK